MAKTYGVSGMKNVLKNINQFVAETKGANIQGLIRSAIVVRRAMDKQYPKIPVDTNNLRSSFFLVASDGRIARGQSPTFKTESGEEAAKLVQSHISTVTEAQVLVNNSPIPVVAFGFTAYYAFFVHEKIDPDVNWTRPESGAKFLEQALINNKEEIKKKIKESATIKSSDNGKFFRRITGL